MTIIRLQKVLISAGILGLAIALPSAPAAAQRASHGVIFYEDDYQPDDEPLTDEEKAKKEEAARIAQQNYLKEAERRRREWNRKLPRFTKVMQARNARIRYNARDDIYPFQDRMLRALSSRRLETFANDRALVRYVEALEKVFDETDEDWISFAAPPTMPEGGPIVVAAMFAQDEDVCTDPASCEEEAAGNIVATASRIPSAPNVTNVQSAGVDEGDIIKQIGNYLITLQDGRLFVVDYKTMQLTDRADVYRRDEEGDPIGADWYDEILVQDDHVIVTAYSYEEEATELSVFSLDQVTGKVSRDGVFLISSDDYYSVDNYSSRIIGDTLVLYAPYTIDPEEIDIIEDGWKKPFIRRWLGEDDRDDVQKRGKALFDARDVYRTLLPTTRPTIHTISTCKLGSYRPGRDLGCDTTGFVGPERAEMYVNNSSIYLWTSLDSELEGNWRRRGECKASELAVYPAFDSIAEGALYRITVRTGEVGVVGVRGDVFDQYSMDEYRGRFRALTPRREIDCNASSYDDGFVNHVALLDIPVRQFDTVFREVRAPAFVRLPAPTTGKVQNRFSGDWLLYGAKSLSSYWQTVPDDEEDIARVKANYVVAVPTGAPTAAAKLPLGHSVVRLELVGEGAVANGYGEEHGLTMSFLKLGDAASVSDSLFLKSRFETEGRSHAFNNMTSEDGASIVGVPTSFNEDEGDQYYWRSDASDLSFVTVSAEGKLANSGVIINKTEDETETDESYECEVSCIDWYGNARPIFLDGRIYGLMGNELVQAELVDGQVVPRRRIDLTAPVVR